MDLKKSVMLVCLLGSGVSLAGTMGEVVVSQPRFYVGAEGGGSVSLKANFQTNFSGPGIRALIFTAPANSDWSRDFETGGFGGAFIGYNYNPNVALQFTWDYRTGYNYFLQASYVGTDGSLTSQDYFQSLGNINIQTFLFDLFLKPSVDWGGFVPYVKGGIGASYNHFPVLQNKAFGTVTTPAAYDVRRDANSVSSFAWDAGAGADYSFNDKWRIGLNYRFVDAGRLASGNYSRELVSGTSGFSTSQTARHVYLNEFAASVAYQFDFGSFN